MKQPERFYLTEGEKLSPVWQKLIKHWEARLETLRNENDGNIDVQATASLRGRIAEIKAILSLDKELKII